MANLVDNSHVDERDHVRWSCLSEYNSKGEPFQGKLYNL